MAYLKYRLHAKEIFAFISVRYTITDIQIPENLQYIIRGAKWNDVKNVRFSYTKCEKWILPETYKTRN